MIASVPPPNVWVVVVSNVACALDVEWTPVTTCPMNSQEGCDPDPSAEDSIEDAYG